MQRPASILVAAMIVAVSAASVGAPVQASTVRIVPSAGIEAATGNAVEKVGNRKRHHNRHHRRHHRRHHVQPFFFGFPFVFPPHHYGRRLPRDCFRTRDGRVYCRRYY